MMLAVVLRWMERYLNFVCSLLKYTVSTAETVHSSLTTLRENKR